MRSVKGGLREERMQQRVAVETRCEISNSAMRPHTTDLEGELADEQLGGLLIAADLAERDRPGAVAVGLLHAAGGGRGLARRLGGELLAGRLAAGGLARGLLGAGHV